MGYLDDFWDSVLTLAPVGCGRAGLLAAALLFFWGVAAIFKWAAG